MAVPVKRTLDFENVTRQINLPNAVSDQEPATFGQLKAAIEGLSNKDNVRVRAPANVNLAAPGATIDGVTMAVSDRFLAPAQTTATEIGIYIYNGSGTPATRSLDANTFEEMESALVTVDEGTSAGTTWRQTAVNGVLGTNPLAFVQFGTGAVQATETASGIAELATQAETDAGTDDLRIVTPLKLATSPFARKAFAATFGDGSATSYVVTHNLNSLDVQVGVREVGGSQREVLCEVQHTSVNSVTLLFDAAVASNSLRATVKL